MLYLKLVALSIPVLVYAQEGKRPQHWFHPSGTLTVLSGKPAVEIGIEFLQTRRGELRLETAGLAGVYLLKEYKTAHNGVTHLVYRQRFQGIEIENAEFTVNVDRDGQIINAGGILFDPLTPGGALPEVSSAMKSARVAAQTVDPGVGDFQPFQTGKSFDGRSLSFSGGRFASTIDGTLVWYAVRGKLRPAWKFEMTAADGFTPHLVVVDAEREEVLEKRTLANYQRAQGLVFETSPVPNPKPGEPRAGVGVFVPRKLVSFEGDPMASPRGWVKGTETEGNNSVVGANPLGFRCNIGVDICPPRPKTVPAPNLDFSFPLELGPGAPPPTNYLAAATTNLFYLVNRAHDFFYAYGFDEQAGNFQVDNFGHGGVGGDPVYAYSHFGVASAGTPFLDNAFFSSGADDGKVGSLHVSLNSGDPTQTIGFLTDDSYDAETVIHEYAHGVSRRSARQLYTTFQGGAMGEAISDFYALEYTVPEGAPAGGVYPIFEYSWMQLGRGLRTRPYSTNMDLNALTFANLGKVIDGPEVHADGEIFHQALWEMRANLIAQHGEKEGRRRARLLLMDGMKLSPPASSMLDMRDAILLADLTDFKGASQKEIWAGFARRGMGVLAQTGDGNSVHIAANYDTPSPLGSLRFYESSYVIGEPVRVVLQDSNNMKATADVEMWSSSGDLQKLTLQRKGQVFAGVIATGYIPAARGSGFLGVIPGDHIVAYYTDEDTGSGPKQVSYDVKTMPDYSLAVAAPVFRFSGEQPMRLRGVTTSALVGLPFEFPFFSEKYPVVRVYANGILTLGTRDVTPCNDIASLALIPSIAPMWMGMRTNGGAQTGEDVYMSSTSESMTFRWVGETDPFSLFQSPDPVNFAATLFADGRIVFQYGTGNKNLSAGGQGFGCPTTTATVGISNGHETFVQLAPHDGAGTLENAPVLIWDPPFANQGGPVANLELPVPGQDVQGPIIVQGTVYDADPGARIRRVDIIVDGRPMTTAAIGTARPDFCLTTRVPQCPAVGFRRILDPGLLGLKAGAHTIQLRATNHRGVIVPFPEEPVNFTLSDGPSRVPVGAIENPADGSTITETVPLRGWVSAQNLLIAGVDVLVDGITFGRASYGVSRPEICAAQMPSGANCPAIGFVFTLDTRNGLFPLTNGPHTLQVRAQDESGRFTLVPETPVKVTVNNERTDPPKGVLVSPINNQVLTGSVRITGHAWDPNGRILQVLLLVDGVTFAAIPYGRPRPEECAALTGVTACPNIGFEADFDSRLLTNGPHILGIVVINDRGGLLRFPLVTSDGINVFVSN